MLNVNPILSILLIISLLLTIIGCNNKKDQWVPAKDVSKTLLEQVQVSSFEMPYEWDYMSIDSTRLSIKVHAMPSLFDLESMQSRAKQIQADGKFIEYGVESISQVIDTNLNLKFCEANEVGFRKRYEHFVIAKVNHGYILDCGLTIGDPARLLLETSPTERNIKQKSIRYDKLSEIQFFDHWGIYTHTYKIKDGMIESLEIEF